VYRGYFINRKLDAMSNITVDDMKQMQTDNYNVKAELSKDILLKIDISKLSADEKKYFDIYKSWNLRNDVAEKGATVFTIWWRELEKAVWSDEIDKSGLPLPWPNETTLVESLHKDSAYHFLDNINTPAKETLEDDLLTALRKATDTLKKVEAN